MKMFNMLKFLVLAVFLSVVIANPVENGAKQSRIAGGTEVDLSQYPFAAALMTSRDSGTAFQQACGGTVLTNNAILTAASCFYNNGQQEPLVWWRVRVGSVLSNRGGFLHYINDVIPHPQFSAVTSANDIAILKPTVNITLQAGSIQAARIVGGAFTLSVQQPVIAIGWGIPGTGQDPSERLREVQIWVVPHQTCANRYQELGVTLADSVVCTGWLDVGVRGQCQGDAGSPILVNGAVVGVHSWAEGCAQGWYPGINTAVGPHATWIVLTALG